MGYAARVRSNGRLLTRSRIGSTKERLQLIRSHKRTRMCRSYCREKETLCDPLPEGVRGKGDYQQDQMADCGTAGGPNGLRVGTPRQPEKYGGSGGRCGTGKARRINTRRWRGWNRSNKVVKERVEDLDGDRARGGGARCGTHTTIEGWRQRMMRREKGQKKMSNCYEE